MPLARPRIGKFGGYNPTAKKIDGARLYLKSAYSPVPLSSIAIRLHLIFTMPMPKSWSKHVRQEADGTPHIGRPDLDNLVKFTCDVGNGVLWDDDCTIYIINASKRWGVTGSTDIAIQTG